MHETLFWLSRPDVRQAVEAVRAEVQRGETTSGDEVEVDSRVTSDRTHRDPHQLCAARRPLPHGQRDQA
ncbi:hypothetical protein [Geodermatophilus maliterrae]|uniref:Uncharacterized protein n=1 Tax=Geodermatophilus maliterrae TaxID=3162531 RepID=A0ABV3XKP8_9ACTN